MHQVFAGHRARNPMIAFGKLLDGHFEWQVLHWQSERMSQNILQYFPGAFLSVDAETLLEFKFVQGMQSDDVVQMKMTEEEINWFSGCHVFIQFSDTVSRIENGIVIIGLANHTGCIACLGTEPSVGPKKNDFHSLCFSLLSL